MKININNYEEYFLLYLDNELSTSEKQEVEEFLDQNPKYKRELELLLKAKVDPAPSHNSFESSLFKLPSGINAEEAMLLDVDGELSPVQLAELEELSKSFPQLLKEREVMNTLTLKDDEQISFRDKAVLYRHESRVVSFRLWKPAIAAALIGAGLFFGLDQINRPDKAELAAIVEDSAPLNNDALKNEKKPGTSAVKRNSVDDGNELVESTTEPKAEPGKTLLAAVHVSEPGKKSVKANANAASFVERKKEAVPVLENINNLERNNQAYTPVSLQKRMELNMAPPDDVKVDVERLTASRPLDADLTTQQSEYARTIAGDSENSSSIGHVLIVDEEKVNRSKLGGFVRKVKRTIEKKTKINLPDEVRLGGFEIAIK